MSKGLLVTSTFDLNQTAQGKTRPVPKPNKCKSKFDLRPGRILRMSVPKLGAVISGNVHAGCGKTKTAPLLCATPRVAPPPPLRRQPPIRAGPRAKPIEGKPIQGTGFPVPFYRNMSRRPTSSRSSLSRLCATVARCSSASLETFLLPVSPSLRNYTNFLPRVPP